MVNADNIPGDKIHAIAYLHDELTAMFPDDEFVVSVTEGTLGGNSNFVQVQVYENVSEGVKVTWHNAKTQIMLVMHLTDGFGRVVDLDKVSFELSSRRGDFKFRKISDKSIFGASKKLVKWFEKNREAFNI